MNPFENPRSWRRAVNDIVYFSRAFLKLEPHPGQAAWLRRSSGLENALVTGNRWGKSEIQAVKLLHRALFQVRPLDKDSKEYYRCANVSVTQDQAGIIFDKALGFIGRSRRFKAFVKEIRQTPFPHITLKNGSEIWARSTYNRGEHLLGHDFDYVNFDEAAYEPYGEWVVDGVIKLRLADRGGVLDFSSTPNGLNWFYKRCLAIEREKRGHLQHGSTFDNPYLSGDYLNGLKACLSASRAAQHLYGKFTSFEGRLFPEDVIQRCLISVGAQHVARPVHTDARMGAWAAPVTSLQNVPDDSFYIHGWDLARKVTYTVGVTLEVSGKPFRVENVIRMQREWPATIRMIKEVHGHYGGVTIIDSTGLGDVVLSELNDIGAVGFNFGGGNRDLLLANLERAIFAGEVAWPDVQYPDGNGGAWSLTDEIRAMDKSYENVGDGVCALALALWQVRQRAGEMPLLRPSVGRF